MIWESRYRRIPGGVAQFDERGRMIPGSASQIGHAMRAAINTPIQGSAADIVMMAMLKLWKSEKLKELGWKLLLQIHDEVILEGPIESRDEVSCNTLFMKEVVRSFQILGNERSQVLYGESV